MRFRVFAFFLVLLLAGCGNAAKSNNNASEQAKTASQPSSSPTLAAENINAKNEPSEMLNKAQKYYDNKDFSNLSSVYLDFTRKYPKAKETENVKKMYEELRQAFNAAKEKSDKELKVKEQANKTSLAAAIIKMRKKYDEVTEITWYYDKSTVQYINENSFYAYFGMKKGEAPFLYLEIQYAGDNWVFINRYVFKVDGATYELSPDYGEVKRDNDSAVWEYYNTSVQKQEYDIISAIIRSKKTIIRHQGDQHYFDRTVTASEKKALQNVLDAYEAMGGAVPT